MKQNEIKAKLDEEWLVDRLALIKLRPDKAEIENFIERVAICSEDSKHEDELYRLMAFRMIYGT